MSTTREDSCACCIFMWLVVGSISKAGGALGEAKHLCNGSGGVARIKGVVAKATSLMLLSRVVGSFELVLDAEVVDLIERVVGPARQGP